MKHYAPNHLLVYGPHLALLLIILYQLTNFEAIICNTFRDILFTNLLWLNLQRAITQKSKNNFFLKFY